MTKACKAWVRIGSRTPAYSAILVTLPPTALITMPAAIGPLSVSTPVNSVAVTGQAGDFGVLQHVNSEAHCPLRVGPYHPVVAGGAGPDVMRCAQHRVAAAAGEVDLGADLLDLLRTDHHGFRRRRRCLTRRSSSFLAHPGLGVRHPNRPLVACMIQQPVSSSREAYSSRLR